MRSHPRYPAGVLALAILLTWSQTVHGQAPGAPAVGPDRVQAGDNLRVRIRPGVTGGILQSRNTTIVGSVVRSDSAGITLRPARGDSLLSLSWDRLQPPTRVDVWAHHGLQGNKLVLTTATFAVASGMLLMLGCSGSEDGFLSPCETKDGTNFKNGVQVGAVLGLIGGLIISWPGEDWVKLW